jgi:hypothetical protein
VRSGGLLLSGRGSKLVAILLVAIVIAAGVGYWLLAPKTSSQSIMYTTQQTSVLTSSVQTSQSSTSSTTFTSAPATTLWINVTATKPVGYYVSLLKSTQTQPYVQLAWELQALPDATNATAVGKITYLALNATNPEVKEAFELMTKGGTPNPSDFTYMVPQYNTELQVLYWLALQNEFKKDDTLALAIAMVNALWLTMGDNQVREAVKNDTSDVLRFFRETNELQKQREYHPLEDYPLEAKIALAWTGNSALRDGPHSIFRGPNSVNPYRNERRMDLAGYLWDTVNVTTLRKMRTFMDHEKIVASDAGVTVGNLEHYLYFSNVRNTGEKGGMDSDHWYYVYEDLTPRRVATIVIDGEPVKNYVINNVDWLFSHLIQSGRGIGQCGDEAALVDGFAKSYGIATLPAGRMVKLSETTRTSHGYVIYYHPKTRDWRVYENQLYMDIDWIPGGILTYFTIIKPPVNQHGYLHDWMEGVFWCGTMTYLWRDTTMQVIRDTFLKGLPTSQMKQWLLYS